jgi:hypothetical protein
MTFYAVESKRQAMRTTSIVNEVKDWVDGPDGKRRPSEVQARDEESGLPLWDVEVQYRQEAFGRASTATAFVRVGSAVKPVLGEFAPVSFVGLSVEVRVTKAGGLSESWRAEAVDDKTTSGTSAGSGSSSSSSPSQSGSSGKAA